MCAFYHSDLSLFQNCIDCIVQLIWFGYLDIATWTWCGMVYPERGVMVLGRAEVLCSRVRQDLRSTLHLDGADVVHATLHDVLAGGGELHAPPLEILLVIDRDLETHTHHCITAHCSFFFQ